ncbi:MAG: polymorphic toxin type 23 domain-containing protein [Bacteroidia bacterium]|nr:polymorphic toxin type 23 domain-containing protein [Bacteroidia bacterium]MDW8348151.1 polymorphic toxin type 23 domain-containing protein [Bacteroidia bacterium]
MSKFILEVWGVLPTRPPIKARGLIVFLYHFFCIVSVFGQVNTFYYLSGHVRLGMPINRLGVVAGVGIAYQHIQVQTQVRMHYAFTHWVQTKRTPELQYSLGGLLTWGSPNMLFIHELMYQNFTPYVHAVGYTHHWYVDRVKTSQRTGSISLQIHKCFFLMENDVFAGQGRDDFRTGAFKLIYQVNSLHAVGLSSILWTGMSQGGIRVDSSIYPARFGYKDLSNTLYGRQSRGILSVQYSYFYPFLGILQGEAGIDAEPIRHLFQNKLIHDMPFLPKDWNRAKNPHYPMLDEEGKPYIDPSRQRIRKARPYFQVSVAPSSFY